MLTTVLVTIAMNLYARISIGEVLKKVAKGLRYIWPDPDYPVAKANAFCYRRYQLGPRPLANLFHRVCRPMTSARHAGRLSVRTAAHGDRRHGRGRAGYPGRTWLPLAGILATGATAPFPKCRRFIWPNVAPTPLWMPAFGPAKPPNGSGRSACCAR